MARLFMPLLVLLAAGGTLRADTAKTPPVHTGPKVSIQGYGKQNPRCQRWTDGCVLCSRADEATNCSTPGIACLPHGVTCKAMLPQ